MVGWLYLLLISMAPLPSQTDVLLTSMGKYFLVAGPSQNQMEKRDGSMMVFHLSTYSPVEFQVSLVISMTPNKESTVFTLNQTRVVEHKVEINSLIEVNIGLMQSFFFEGPKYFGLSVLFMNHFNLVSAAYLAVPIRAWGSIYYVVTAKLFPYIQMVSARMYNKVEVDLNLASDNLVFVYKHTVYKSKQSIMVTLNSFEAFSISNCSAEFIDHSGSLTGTSITGTRPLGVISGNCYSKQTPLDELCDNDSLQADMSAEMLLTTEISALEYVYPTLPKRQNPSLMSITSVKNKTRVTFVNEKIGAKAFPRKGFIVEIPVDVSEDNGTTEVTGNFLVKGSAGILVLYSQSSGCYDHTSDEHPTTPTMGIIIPAEMFSYAFVWKTPQGNMSHYILIMIESNYTADLMYDMQSFSKAFPSIVWSASAGSSLKLAAVTVAEGEHWLETSTMMNFACYLYGFGTNTSYMYAAGFHGCALQPEASVNPFMNETGDNNVTLWVNKTMDSNATMWFDKTMDGNEPEMFPYDCWDQQKLTTAEVITTMPTGPINFTVGYFMTTFMLPPLTPTDAYFQTDPTFDIDTSSEKPETIPPNVEKDEGSNAIYAIVLLLLIPLGLLIYMSLRRQKAAEEGQLPSFDVDVGHAPSEEMPFVVVPDETHVAIDEHTPVEVVRVRRLSGWGTPIDPTTPPKARKLSTGSVASRKSGKSQKSNKSGGSN